MRTTPQGDQSPRPILLAAAAPAEARAVLAGIGAEPLADSLTPPGQRMGSKPKHDWPWTRLEVNDRFHLVLTGVGKANAAAAVARTLDPTLHSCVLSVGIAGALPGSGVEIGQSICATACVYADEGVLTPDGFMDCAEIGFPLGPFGGKIIRVPDEIIGRLSCLADRTGPIATVSTCSGTDELAATVAERTGALAEAMEGAACAHIASLLGVAAGELRTISNRTGDRSAGGWDVPRALSRLRQVIGALARTTDT